MNASNIAANVIAQAAASAAASTAPADHAPRTAQVNKGLPAGIVGKTTGYNIDPKKVTFREGWNNRFDMGDIESLANGIHETLKRNPGRPYTTDIEVMRIAKGDERLAAGYLFEVVTGHRRILATQLLLKKGVTFPEGINARLVAQDESVVNQTLLLFTENNQKPLLPLEEAAAFKRLRDQGMTILQIAHATGKADVHVTDTLALLDADEEVKEAVKTGAVGVTIAKVIATTARDDKNLQKELLNDAKEAGKGKGKTAEAKAAKARMLKKIELKKQAKAAAKGRVLKMRPLALEELNTMGQKMARLLETKTREASFKFETIEDFTAHVAKDEKLVAAFTLGAMLALRAAAGIKTNLDI